MFLLALVGIASAAPININGNNVHDTIACTPGQAVNVNGNAAHLTFTGDCGALRVTGNDAVVDIDGVARITLLGTGNAVTWHRNLSGAKKLPKTIGVGNTITKAP